MDDDETRTGFTVHQAAAMMPEVSRVRGRARALAVIGLITDSHSACTYIPAGCTHRSGAVLLADEESRRFQVHFHEDAGTVIYLWDTDACFMRFPDQSEVDREACRAVVDQVPPPLRPCLWNGNPTRVADSELPYITAVMWRLPGDTAWRTPVIPSDEMDDPLESWSDYDHAVHVLADLLAPSPGTVMMAGGLVAWGSSGRRSPSPTPSGRSWPCGR
ncbi:hypothetical protein ACOZFM_28720 [Streptomyces arboris]|uniref:hypothetical protein n=1 Tax=Streptomyces arboris TaxID=2600619 RepID=UPI003BF57393